MMIWLIKFSRVTMNFLKSEIKQLLKKYVNLSEWDSPSATATQSPDKNSELEPSVYLTPLISLLPQYLDIISRSVSQLDYFYN